MSPRVSRRVARPALTRAPCRALLNLAPGPLSEPARKEGGSHRTGLRGVEVRVLLHEVLQRRAAGCGAVLEDADLLGGVGLALATGGPVRHRDVLVLRERLAVLVGGGPRRGDELVAE